MSTPSGERDDLLLLAAALLAVPAGWLLLGWRWPLCVSGYDAWATALPLLHALREGGGDWGALAYRPDLLGGVRLRDSVGPNPLAALLARAGLSATGVYDLATFALQALIGFFGARAAGDLARTWSPAEPRGSGWAPRLLAVVPCAFAPFLGWRIGYGHLAMTTGLLPFAAALALVAATGARRMTVTLGVLAALATAHGLLFTGHQLVLYGAVFGAPLLAGLWLSARVPARTLAGPAAALAAGLLLALPALTGVLQHGLSSDAPRSPVGMRITYSYLTAGALDWLGSLAWTRAAVPPSRPALHHHESNLALGPLVALLALVPWRRLRPLAWGLGLASAMVLVFSTNLRPLSTLLIAAVPPLGSFRVPTRAAMPLLLALTPLAVAAAVHAAPGADSRSARAGLAGLAGFVALFLAPPPLRELLGWSLALAMVAWRGRFSGSRAAATLAAVLALSGGALGAFGQRLLTPFRDTEALLAQARALGQSAGAAHPELRDPLVRVQVTAELPELGANTAFAAGLSSLDGYFFPPRRLIALVAALRGQPYHPSAFVVRVRPEEPAARALFPLYNVRWRAGSAAAVAAPSVPEGVPPIHRAPPGPLALSPLGPTAGPAWFSEAVEVTPSMESLAAALREAGDGLAEKARRVQWIVGSDAAAQGLAPAGAACGEARVTAVHATRAGRFEVAVSAAADCPLTLATNYAESLEARVQVQGAWRRARTFPAYGALLGVWVPGGATDIVIAAR